MDAEPKVPVLTGPTASGKTAALLRIRRRGVPLEVVSADSRQVYRGMDVGTAKPSPAEMELLPHHLVDIMDPDGEFSAGAFVREAGRLVGEIRARGGIPVVAGGTVLYVMALLGALDPMPDREEGVREGLRNIEAEEPGSLHLMLERADPELAAGIGGADTARLVRALEVLALTGRRPSELRKGGDPAKRHGYRVVCLDLQREELRRRIAARALSMVRGGLVEETRALLDAGWGRESAPGRTIGYRETLDWLDAGGGEIEDLAEAIAASTWRMARRQRNMLGRIEGMVRVGADECAGSADRMRALLLGDGG